MAHRNLFKKFMGTFLMSAMAFSSTGALSSFAGNIDVENFQGITGSALTLTTSDSFCRIFQKVETISNHAWEKHLNKSNKWDFYNYLGDNFFESKFKLIKKSKPYFAKTVHNNDGGYSNYYSLTDKDGYEKRKSFLIEYENQGWTRYAVLVTDESEECIVTAYPIYRGYIIYDEAIRKLKKLKPFSWNINQMMNQIAQLNDVLIEYKRGTENVMENLTARQKPWRPYYSELKNRLESLINCTNEYGGCLENIIKFNKIADSYSDVENEHLSNDIISDCKWLNSNFNSTVGQVGFETPVAQVKSKLSEHHDKAKSKLKKAMQAIIEMEHPNLNKDLEECAEFFLK